MASLYYRTRRYTLSEANENIGEVTAAITNGLPRLGYTGVNNAGGFKGNYLLTVFYLYIGNRDFWQVAVCGGSGDDVEAGRYLDEVENMIRNFNWM